MRERTRKIIENSSNQWRITSFGMLLVMLLTACNSAPNLVLWEHPLSDKIWDVKHQTFIDRQALMNRALASEYLLVGEHHDNRVHHQHQAWIVQQLVRYPNKVSVAFEMIDNVQAEHLDRQSITSVNQLIDTLNKSINSWDYKRQYRSLFSEVLSAGYQIDMANLNTRQLMDAVRQGEENLPEEYKRMLDRTPLSAEHLSGLQQVIIHSHCGMLDEKSSKPLVLAQRVRDAVMAVSLLNSEALLKVLIAGNGHVRNDRAVPHYLRSNLDTQVKQVRTLSIGMVEVESAVTEPEAYGKRWGISDLPFDIVWFTPQVNRDDPCEKLLKHFKKHKKTS